MPPNAAERPASLKAGGTPCPRSRAIRSLAAGLGRLNATPGVAKASEQQPGVFAHGGEPPSSAKEPRQSAARTICGGRGHAAPMALGTDLSGGSEESMRVRRPLAPGAEHQTLDSPKTAQLGFDRADFPMRSAAV